MIYVIRSLYILYALGVLSLIFNLVRSAYLVRRQRALPPAGDVPVRSSLDVVIPVKDEERNIGTCIESVLAQDHAATKIIVVNDRSTDGTARAVQAMQDRHPQIRRVDIAELPPGLYGKPHAIDTIAPELKSDYIAFVDSDLRLNPACLGTLVHHLEANDLDWVAVMGAPEVSRFWERVIVPIFGAVIFAWYDPRKISDPKWPNAIGSALMVCRRTAYEAIGGHGAVIDIYDEDSELVRIAKRAGQKLSFVLTPELFTQRHYGGLAATIRGMTRTFVGGLKTIPRLLFTAGSLAFIGLLPLTILILVPVAAAWGQPVIWERLWWVTAVVHLHMSIILSFLVYHTAGVARRLALLHPIGSLIMIYVCFRSAVHMLRHESIAWRGTKY
ncbi:MAG TPA: glycosyltransferase family 2 protein [Phycisphaerae bacterium]|nr:glycosyltransferase family 2 protein [Phycisphaerae bacterium]